MKSHPIRLNKLYGVYVDYTLEALPRAFYVGKGQQARVKSVKRNMHHARISEKHGVKRELVFETDDPTEAAAKEVELIATFKTYVYDPGYAFGANYTAGGEGAPGRKYKPTLEALKRQSDAQRGKKRGPHSPEHCAAISAGLKGKSHSIHDLDAFRKKCSENQKRRMQDPELRKKTGDASRGKPGACKGRKYTDEQRVVRSEQLKAAWVRRREEAASRGEGKVTTKPQTPEQKKARSEALKAHWAKKRQEKDRHMNKLTTEETNDLIKLLIKADPRAEVAGRYEVIITPTTYAPEDFVPRKRVCIGDVANVVGEVTYTKVTLRPADEQ